MKLYYQLFFRFQGGTRGIPGFLPGIFSGGGSRIYCYANFVFGPNFGGGETRGGGVNCFRGGGLPHLWKKAKVICYFKSELIP